MEFKLRNDSFLGDIERSQEWAMPKMNAVELDVHALVQVVPVRYSKELAEL